MKKKRLIAKILVIVMMLSLLPSPSIKAETGTGSSVSSGNAVITHYTMLKKGSKIVDVSGNGHDATLVGFEDSDFKESDGIKSINFTGNKSKYIKVPNGAIGDDESFTIETTFRTAKAANHWLYCFGTKMGAWPNVNNYVFCNPLQSGGTIRCGIKNSTDEKLTQDGKINTSTYNTITAVYSAGTIQIYINSVLAGTVNHSYSVQDILKAGVADASDCIGYIGRSLYTPDDGFTGDISDFKVYNYSLTADEIKELADHKLITHYDMELNGDSLKDVTGNGHDAKLVGLTSSDIVDDNGSSVLNFTGDNSKYATLPQGAVGDDETFTVETTFSTAKAANHWLYCLGTKIDVWPNVKNYIFCNPLQSGGTIRYGIKDSSAEVLSQNGKIDTSSYNKITAVFSNGSINIYLNGTLVGTIAHSYNVQSIIAAGQTTVITDAVSGSAITVSGAAVSTDSTTIIGYIGKSLYSPDPAFTGKLKDFKVYNYAKTAEEIGIEKYSGGLSDGDVVAATKAELTIPDMEDIRGNITLPTVSRDGASISWSSSDESIVSVKDQTNAGYDSTPAGVVKRQSTDTKVTLTATIKSGSATDTKTFDLTIIAKPEQIKESDYTDYLFTHFIGENGHTAEQIYFSASRDGFNWKDLNSGDAVLTSTLGDGGVRDPFILRTPDGDKFYLIATDLCIGGGTSWGTAQYGGSRSLIIWESDDLVHWSKPRSVEVGVDGAGCVWAPEAIYDEKTGEYLVYWASMVKLDGDSAAKQRIYYAKTRDFYTFTKAQVYLEKANHVIDTTMTYSDGKYYRYSKDETNKVINVDSSSQLLHSTWTNINSTVLSKLQGVEGPLIYKLNADDASKDTWCLMVDQFASGKGYLPLVTNDLSSGNFTQITDYNLGSTLKRHGTVMRLTAKEYQALQKAYGSTVTEVDEPEKKDAVISYNFDETLSGTAMKDSSGNKQDGKLYGKATYVTDKDTNSQALYLDGSDGTYAAFPDNFFTGRNKFTISMDIKPVVTDGNFFTWAVGKDNNKYMFLRTRDTQIRNAITKSSYGAEDEAVATVKSIKNKWSKITIVVNGTSMDIYQNGVLIAKNHNLKSQMTDLGNNLVSYLGKSFYSGDGYFKGYFDNIQIYNRALTETEIAKENNVKIQALKGASAPGYRIITTKTDSKNNILNLYFSKSNSKNTDLTSVMMSLDVDDKCTLKTDISKGINLTGSGTKLEFTVPGEAAPQVWTIKGSWCNNPVLGGQYADPDIDVFGDTYYIYPTTDGYSGWSGTKFHVFSSKDMVKWTDHGVILDVSKDVNWSVGSAWAPTIEEKNGKYYFYFCAKNSSGTSCIGVATSDSPTGPFTAEKDPLLTPAMCSGIKMGQTIDPSIFTDDDGKSYLLFGNGEPAVVELNDDMISIKKDTLKNLTGLKDFRESVTVIKRNGVYHFTWSCDDTGSDNYHVNYGTSNSLYGPVTYQYTVLQKDSDNDILGTGHQSMVKVPGKDAYYMAYHRFYTPIGLYTSGLGYHRETCIDQVTFDDKTGLMNVITPTLQGVAVTEPIISKDSASFNKYSGSSEYNDITFNVTLNGNSLEGIKNGSSGLVEGTDYRTITKSDSVAVTIYKTYLSKQAEGNLNLALKFNNGVTKTLVIKISNTNNSSSGGSSNSGPVSNPSDPKVIIGDQTGTGSIPVKVITDSNGTKTTQIELSQDHAKAVVSSAITEKKDTATIDLTSVTGTEGTDQMKVMLPKEATAVLNENKLGLKVKFELVNLVLPTKTVAQSEEGVSITVSAINGEQQIQSSNSLLQQMSEGAVMLSTPVDVKTNFALSTKVTVPIPSNSLPADSNKRKEFIKSLAVLVEHSDGENRIQKGTIEYDSYGNPTGISIWVDKFSTFTLVKTNAEEKVIKIKQLQAADKALTVTYKNKIDTVTVTEDSVYILDSNGNKINATLKVNGNKIVIKPVKKYAAGKTYSIHITQNVHDKSGKAVEAREYIFKIKKK